MNIQKVTEMVLESFRPKPAPVPQEELDLATHLRTNDLLYESLVSVISKRIAGRATVVEPTNPIDCKVHLARDGECYWLLNLLERARQLPRQESEHPAA